MSPRFRRTVLLALRTTAVLVLLALAGCGGAAATSAKPGPIVFNGSPQGSSGLHVLVMDPDGTNVRMLAPRVFGLSPSWSPDATQIAFEGGADSYECDDPCSQIWVVDADGENAHALTPAAEDARAPRWSPDGKRILFEKWDHQADDGSELYVMNADGSMPTRLTNLAGIMVDASWSPDSERIAFSIDRGDGGDIYVMNSDGSDLTRVADLRRAEVDPNWSPDGDRIAFSARNYRSDIYVMNDDGSKLRRLTDPAVSEYDHDPEWSPDGDTLAFVRGNDDGNAIALANDDGSGDREVRVAKEDYEEFADPLWSPDGKQLLFLDVAEEAIWVMDADGENARRVWSVGIGGQAFGTDWAAARD